VDKKTTKAVSVVSVALGVAFILTMVFDILPGKGNILLFLGIVCFIAAMAMRKISKI